MTPLPRWFSPAFRTVFVLVCSSLSLETKLGAAGVAAGKPNIVFILADDMGYGDTGCYNPESKIRTPNIDRLAEQGIRFTDAHAAGSWCVPSRYALLTGRYPFRSSNNPDAGAVIDPGRMTVASLLHDQGYATAMVGKWHLGFNGGIKFDYSQPLRGGPVDHGFDSYFGLHASTDIPPYFYIENDRVVTAPTAHIDAHATPGWSPIQGEFWREGPIAPKLKHEDVLPILTTRSIDWLEQHQRTEPARPFFLYVALTGPHTPWVPIEKFRGKSAAGLYGDFNEQVDDTVGQITRALERLHLAENTLVFFASDNGPVWYPADIARLHHSAAGPWRGIKGDVWEGGHRLPLIARWPGRIPPHVVNAETVSFTDLLATCAAILQVKLPVNAAEDSFSILPALLGQAHPQPLRAPTMEMSYKDVNYLTIREGDWKLVNGLGSGGFTEPIAEKPVPGGPSGQLYNLATDPTEQHNVWLENPTVVALLSALMKKYQDDGRSRPQ